MTRYVHRQAPSSTVVSNLVVYDQQSAELISNVDMLEFYGCQVGDQIMPAAPAVWLYAIFLVSAAD